MLEKIKNGPWALVAAIVITEAAAALGHLLRHILHW